MAPTFIQFLVAGAWSNGVTGALFHGNVWGMFDWAFISLFITLTALKRDKDEIDLLEFGLYPPVAMVAGFLVTYFYSWMFCLPAILDTSIMGNLYFDHTSDEEEKQLKENDQAGRKCKKIPHPHARRRIFVQTQRYWPVIGLQLSFYGIALAGHFFLGLYDSVITQSRADTIGGAVVGVSVLTIFVSVWDMWNRPSPWSHHDNNRTTLKYYLVGGLAMFYVAPIFFDTVIPGDALTRGFAMTGVFVGLWLIFYLWSQYAGRDHVFTGRSYDALWFAVLGFITHSVGYASIGVADLIKEGDGFTAMISQVVASALLPIIYYVIKSTGLYHGYNCTRKCHLTSKKE